MTILEEIQKFLMSFSTPKQQIEPQRRETQIREPYSGIVVNSTIPAKRDWEIIGN